MPLAVISDAAIAAIVDRIDFAAAVRSDFVAIAEGKAQNAPVIRAPSDAPDHGVNVKFGALLDEAAAAIGGKVGTYWPENAAAGLANHGAATLLLDPQTGYAQAFIAARLLNRLRTAAGDAVAVDALAREDASVLALVGAGAQAPFEARAIARVRRLREIRIASRSMTHAAAIARELADLAPDVTAMPMEAAIRGANIIVTATASRGTLFAAGLVAEGTHISAMGADAVGKQELDPAIFQSGATFADWPQQARIIGECQHAGDAPITALGAVLNGTALGRDRADQITIFDSSGLAVQDLAVARAAYKQAQAAGLVQKVDF